MRQPDEARGLRGAITEWLKRRSRWSELSREAVLLLLRLQLLRRVCLPTPRCFGKDVSVEGACLSCAPALRGAPRMSAQLLRAGVPGRAWMMV